MRISDWSSDVCSSDLMQFQADILDVPVIRPVIIETTALGAAYLAGLAVAFWSSTEEIAAQWQMERCFEPHMKDRKSVVSGKSVSVRVDLGGRRIIKKKLDEYMRMTVQRRVKYK